MVLSESGAAQERELSDPRELTPGVLFPGHATGIGSLPHRDAALAARVVLDCLPDLPAAPQLPSRSSREAMLAQWLDALPEVEVDHDGELRWLGPSEQAPRFTFSDAAHGGLLAFVDALGAVDPAVRPSTVKLQVTGPLTLGVALHRLGASADQAFERGVAASSGWGRAVSRLVRDRIPGVTPVVFLDEPALVAWRRREAPIHHDDAVDLLSRTLASIDAVTGVHVCGDGEVAIATEAGPRIVGVEVRPDLVRDVLALGRHLEGGGWIAWGAVPTDRPVGTSPDPHWRAVLELWCELTRLGIDPLALRSRALVTPACGLAGHGESQAERALLLARAIGRRVGDQAAATRLAVGA